MTERKLAYVRRIDDIVAIDGADSIECAVLGGWNVVTKKGEFKAGDLAVYLEIDSWVPKDLAPFLFEGKVFEGVEGARLRTKKLRGVLSQGLLLPLSVAYQLPPDTSVDIEGTDLTEALGIKKWEKPLDPTLSGLARGNFPSWIPKTDQERVQNLNRTIEQRQGDTFEASIKLDGSSITVYSKKEDDGYLNGVCSRNLDLQEGESAFWVAAKQYKIHEKLQSTGRSLAVQGELLNTNIQGNWEKVTGLCMYVFDVFDIEAQKYLTPVERRALCKELDIPHVPVLEENWVLDTDVKGILAMADGPGMNPGVKREGLVFKSNTDDFSFKAISNAYLLKAG